MTPEQESGPYRVEHTEGMYFINGPRPHKGPWSDPAGAEDWCAQLNAAYHDGAHQMRERCAAIADEDEHWRGNKPTAGVSIRALPLIALTKDGDQ